MIGSIIALTIIVVIGNIYRYYREKNFVYLQTGFENDEEVNQNLWKK